MPAEELYERAEELEALRRLVSAAADGTSGLSVVLGPPGAGKTSLLLAARAEARARGVLVLGARGSPQEREYPFAVVRALLGPVVLAADADERERLFSGAASHAQRLFESHTEPSSLTAAPAYAMLHGLFWLLAEVAQSTPLLVIVDDAHWSDAASARFLEFLARRVEGLAVSVLLSARVGEGAEQAWLQEIGDDPSVRVLSPAPLSPETITAFAARRLRDPPDPELGQACWQATGGNPFFVAAALAELAVAGTARSERAACLRTLAPESVLRTVLVRLARLPAGAVALAHAVAVLGDGAVLAQAAALAEITLHDGSVAAENLCAIGVFNDPGKSLGFVHPIVRNALYRDLTATAAADLHARAARLISGAGADPVQIAVHLMRSPPGEERAVETLRSAAQSACAQGAPQSAASYLRRGLSEPATKAQRAELLIELGLAETQAGEREGAEHLALGLGASTEPHRRVQAALALAQTLAAAERAEESVALLMQIGDDLTHSHPELAGEVFSELVSLGDLVARRVLPPRAFELMRPDDPAGLTHHAVELTAAGHSAAEASRLAEQALASGELLARGDAVFAFACAMLIYAESYAAARAFLDEAITTAVASASVPGFVGASGQRALLGARCGALVEAEADARAALAAVQLNDWRVWPAHTLIATIEALLARGLPEEAWALVGDAPAFLQPPPDLQGALLLEARGRLLLDLGDAEAAVSDLREAGRRLQEWGLLNPSVAAWRSHAALGLASLGRRAEAIELADKEVVLARRWGTPRALGVALHGQAMTYGDERTTPLLEEACATLARSEASLEHIRVQADLGAALRRSGHRARAREQLRFALRASHAAGAVSLAARVHAELTASGARPRDPWRTGLDALTPSELRIARLAAAGRANTEIAQALFVTIKTIEMHLTNCFCKLGIERRGQLTQVLGAAEPGEVNATVGTR